MMSTRRTGVAIYTCDRTAFSSLDAAAFAGGRSGDPVTASSMFKVRLMAVARLVAVDFTGFSDLSPMSVLFGGLKLALEDREVTVCGIGTDAPPLESIAVTDSERDAVHSAMREGRVKFFGSRTEFLNWEGLREYV